MSWEAKQVKGQVDTG